MLCDFAVILIKRWNPYLMNLVWPGNLVQPRECDKVTLANLSLDN